MHAQGNYAQSIVCCYGQLCLVQIWLTTHEGMHVPALFSIVWYPDEKKQSRISQAILRGQACVCVCVGEGGGGGWLIDSPPGPWNAQKVRISFSDYTSPTFPGQEEGIHYDEYHSPPEDISISS